MLSCFLCLFSLLSLALAQDNTTATSFVSWQPEPDCTSGTASLIWNCITTIGLSTYVVVHVNVAPIILNSGAKLIRKCLIVMIALIFPEVWAWGAVNQLLEARRLVQEARRLKHTISLKQAFFIYSSGIAIRNLPGLLPSAEARDILGQKIPITTQSLWFRNWKHKLSDREIVMFAENVPNDEQIDDRSKQDTLVKIITTGQVAWFVVQVAARAQQGLVITPLQIGTLAYISMAAFTYGCWWYKVYDLGVASPVEEKPGLVDVVSGLDIKSWYVEENREAFEEKYSKHKISRVGFLTPISRAFYQASKACFYDIFYIITISAHRPLMLGMLTAIFTCIHTAAWNYEFPTPIEALLWHVLTCGGILIGPWAFIEITPLASGDWWRSMGPRYAWGYVVYEALWGIFAAIYLISRIYVMVESFIAFRWAPKNVYGSIDWTRYIPHIGS